jgi:protein-disulfide isomerase
MVKKIQAAGILGLLLLAACHKTDTGASNGTAEQSDSTSVSPPSGGDWTQLVSATPDGGYIIGNPAAPVKLLEYASLTCPHCRDFTKEAVQPLRDKYVKSGKVSWEFRSFVLNPIDVAASLLLQCQGPAPIFKLVEQNYAEQEKWIVPYQKLTPDQQKSLEALPQDQQFAGLAKAGGLIDFYKVRGLPSAKAEACLTDKSQIDKLVAIRDHGVNVDKVQGTPTFVVNGTTMTDPPTWANLEAKLKAAGA